MQKLWPVEVCCQKSSKLMKLSNSDYIRTGLVASGQTDLDADLTFFFDWRPKPNSRTLKKARMKLGGTNKNLCEGGGGSIWRGGGRIWWSSGASVRQRRDYGDSNSKL
jgi:hypothetical protein